MKYYGVDTETEDKLLKERGTSWAFGEGHVIVTGVYDAQTKKKIPLDGSGGKEIYTLLTDPAVTLVGARIIYDLGWFCYEHKLRARDVKCSLIDVALVESVIDEYQKYALDDLAWKYLHERKGSEYLATWARSKGFKGDFRKYLAQAWDEVPDKVREYVLSDADQPYRIWERQKEIIEARGLWEPVIRKNKLIKVMLAMKQRGVRIDVKKKAENYVVLKGHQDRLNAEFEEKHGKVNIGSTKQLAELFTDNDIPFRHKLRIKSRIGGDAFVGEDLWNERKRLKNAFAGVRVIKGQLVIFVARQYAARTAAELKDMGYDVTNNPNIDKKALEALRKTHPLAQEIVDLKQVTSIIDKFMGPKFDRFICPDGRIRCDFNISGARQTGRFSSCFSGGTLVRTTRGEVPIADITTQDYVYTHTGAVARVSAVLDQGIKPVYRLTTEAPSDIICTIDHRFMSSSGWKQIQDCTEVVYVGEKYRQDGQCLKESHCRDVPVEGETVCGRRCTTRERDSTDGQVYTLQNTASGRMGGRKGDPVLKGKVGAAKPDERKMLREASPVEGSCVGRQRALDDKNIRRQSAVCPQACDGGVTWPSCLSNSEVRCSPYRREWGEQRAGQPCSCHEERAQKAPSNVVRVKGLSFVGEVQVFDITVVHEDHSFIANGYAVHNCAPNLQQIPSKTVLFRKTDHEVNLAKMCREVLIPDDGMFIGKMDYSGQENVLMAHFAVGPGSKEVRKKYNDNPEFDFHAYMGEATGLYEEYGKEIGRKYAKQTSFGLGYGMQITTMMENFGWDKEQAEHIMEVYNDAAPFVRATMDAVSETIVKRGFIRTLGGKQLHLQKFRGKVDTRSAYKGFNKLIQGSAADMMEEALVKIYEAGLDDYFPLYLTVHDEIDFGVPKTREALKKLGELKYIMEHAILNADGTPSLLVPIRVDPELGYNWGSMHDFAKNKAKFMKKVAT